MNRWYVLGLLQAFGLGAVAMAIKANFNTENAINGLMIIIVCIIINIIDYNKSK